ncbi:MAG: hypothetical protein NVSMB29_13960 [Candidatus Dormibacteria bacterium]
MGDTRAAVIRDSVGIGVATGAYAVSFGAISGAAGLSVAQTCALSLLMFTGASQFALVGILGAGGGGVAAATTAVLLGSRNALYGLRLSTILEVRGWRRPVAAQLVIDESTAMATGHAEDHGRLGFWCTGLAVFVLWNLGTLAGALGARALSDPRVFGLDAAVPAAFLALLAPRLGSGQARAVGVAAAVTALLAATVLPAGAPVLAAALAALIPGALSRRPPSRGAEAA